MSNELQIKCQRSHRVFTYLIALFVLITSSGSDIAYHTTKFDIVYLRAIMRLHMDSWVTIDSCVKPLFGNNTCHQKCDEESSFDITVGSSESFITLCFLRMQAMCQCT